MQTNRVVDNPSASGEPPRPCGGSQVQARGPFQPLALAANNDRPRVLCAEDLLPLRSLYLRVLTRAGYEVTAAADGWQAWTAVESGRVDLVILGDEMRGLSAAELVSKIRLRSTRLPVIVAASDLQFFAEPSNRWLEVVMRQKPFGIGELTETVGRALRNAPETRWIREPSEEVCGL
jgi:two-component system, cell cycle sensor histidine kinase and response regulator CckA